MRPFDRRTSNRGPILTGRHLRIANIARADPQWTWLADQLSLDGCQWHFASSQARSALERRFPVGDLARLRAALTVRRARPDIVFSHGPWETLYTAMALTGRQHVRQIAMSFNFTDLPKGALLAAMRFYFPRIDQFIVFSEIERKLYADLFGLPAERFVFVRWGVRPPIEEPLPRQGSEPYFAALGGEARDYATLAEAARMRPQDRFVFIVRPWSLDGVSVPDNVEVRVNLPAEQAWSTVWHAQASLIPLRNRQAPNGHVTLVGGMLLGKAHIITRSAGISDYVTDGETALLVPPQSPRAFAAAIETIRDRPDYAEAMGRQAKLFAETHCSEQSLVDHIRQILALGQ